jgi:hypothetical protein
MNSIDHNLNIENYNFQELLGIFDLTTDMTIEDLKRAKRKVLYLHPDKSRLPPQYFLFYKKAFEIVVSFYEERSKQDREIPKEPLQYNPTIDRSNNPNTKKMTEVIRQYQSQEDSQKGFQKTFNDLFEQNMAQRPDPTRNQWFHDDTPIFKHEQATTQNLGQVMQTVKTQVASLTKYRGVENMYSGGGGTSFHDDDDSATLEDGAGYIASDLFGKLKFDDLRRVHKDQTVFSVSEQDYDPSTRPKNLDLLSRERNTQDLTPLEKQHAENLLIEQQREYERRMFQKQHESRIRTMNYEQKNQTVMANFLRLQNSS